MAAMLGLVGRDGAGWSLAGTRGRGRALKRRVERRREDREWRREVKREAAAPSGQGRARGL